MTDEKAASTSRRLLSLRGVRPRAVSNHYRYSLPLMRASCPCRVDVGWLSYHFHREAGSEMTE